MDGLVSVVCEETLCAVKVFRQNTNSVYIHSIKNMHYILYIHLYYNIYKNNRNSMWQNTNIQRFYFNKS